MICHYLAHGRRVLVTSKGVPATEVLRKKLPAGIRELCVALGGGDSNSFRTLEGAVEHIANHVAAASPKKLQKEADRLRERFRAIEKELVATERAETEFAAMYFSNSDNSVKRGDLRKILNEEHLSLLGVQTTSTIGQLADAVASILDHDDEEESLPRRAYVLLLLLTHSFSLSPFFFGGGGIYPPTHPHSSTHPHKTPKPSTDTFWKM